MLRKSAVERTIETDFVTLPPLIQGNQLAGFCLLITGVTVLAPILDDTA